MLFCELPKRFCDVRRLRRPRLMEFWNILMKSYDRQHRPEDLVLGELAVRIDVAQDGRLEVEAAGQPGRQPLAGHWRASHHQPPHTLLHGRSHRGQNAGQRIGTDHRTDVSSRHQGIPDGQRSDEGRCSIKDLRVDLALDERATGERALLARRAEARTKGVSGGGIEIGVGEDHVRRLAAEFQ